MKSTGWPITFQIRPRRRIWPRSTANTPSWQVNEDAIRMMVNTSA